MRRHWIRSPAGASSSATAAFMFAQSTRRFTLATPIAGNMPRSIVIVGEGAAGNAAAEMLRREGYGGSITILSADDSLPYDRPNLSKGYLAGSAVEESNPLRSAEFYRKQGIDVKLNARVVNIDTAHRKCGSPMAVVMATTRSSSPPAPSR